MADTNFDRLGDLTQPIKMADVDDLMNEAGVPPEIREQVLDKARTLVTDHRANQYGSARSGFARIADTWNALFGWGVRPWEVAAALAALKLVRVSVNPAHADSWVDLAGYAALGAEVAGAEVAG